MTVRRNWSGTRIMLSVEAWKRGRRTRTRRWVVPCAGVAVTGLGATSIATAGPAAGDPTVTSGCTALVVTTSQAELGDDVVATDNAGYGVAPARAPESCTERVGLS